MKSRKNIYRILGFRWYKKIPFENTFVFDYQGVGHYYINKTRYKVEKEGDAYWMKIDNPFPAIDTPTRCPSKMKITIEESTDGNSLNVEFHAFLLRKIVELAFELFFFLFSLYSLVNMKYIFAGTAFFMAIFPMLAFHLEQFIETRHVISDLKTLCK